MLYDVLANNETSQIEKQALRWNCYDFCMPPRHLNRIRMCDRCGFGAIKVDAVTRTAQSRGDRFWQSLSVTVCMIHGIF